jgi:hypothetical protein
MRKKASQEHRNKTLFRMAAMDVQIPIHFDIPMWLFTGAADTIVALQDGKWM